MAGFTGSHTMAVMVLPRQVIGQGFHEDSLQADTAPGRKDFELAMIVTSEAEAELDCLLAR